MSYSYTLRKNIVFFVLRYIVINAEKHLHLDFVSVHVCTVLFLRMGSLALV